MADEQPRLGSIIDSLGCSPELKEHDLVDSAVVILKIVEPDGTVRLSTCWSENISWLERVGMIRSAEQREHRDTYDET
jgi:hypothetical protein